MFNPDIAAGSAAFYLSPFEAAARLLKVAAIVDTTIKLGAWAGLDIDDTFARPSAHARAISSLIHMATNPWLESAAA
jgi:hypothetical protein